ncbi:hypothetical protein [Actinoplanes sp. NPDC023714]|uniref:hypothetical protein n=1 Tax=Actinoplanes sp. NPDC023714 TaxID=3154322 RepID=UPI0033FD441A
MSQSTTTRGGVTAARVCTILAFVFAVLAFLFSPLLFGLAGLVLGVVGGYLGDRPLGWYAAGASVVGAVLGVIVASALLS